MELNPDNTLVVSQTSGHSETNPRLHALYAAYWTSLVAAWVSLVGREPPLDFE